MSPVHKYFLGERLQCSAGIVLALACIVLAFWLRSNHTSDFYRGCFYPFIIIPFFLLLICTGVIIRTGKDIARVDQFIGSEPEKINSQEIPRMEKVMQNFRWIKIIELILMVTGALIFIIYPKDSLLSGIGMGLLMQALMMYGFDHFAEARGKIYWEFLKSV